MTDYRTALSELDAERHYLFPQEIRLIRLARGNAFRRWGDVAEVVWPAYEAALGKAAGKKPGKNLAGS